MEVPISIPTEGMTQSFYERGVSGQIKSADFEAYFPKHTARIAAPHVATQPADRLKAPPARQPPTFRQATMGRIAPAHPAPRRPGPNRNRFRGLPYAGAAAHCCCWEQLAGAHAWPVDGRGGAHAPLIFPAPLHVRADRSGATTM